MNTITSLSELTKYFETRAYKHICLCDETGKQIIRYNPTADKLNDRITEISNYLNADVTKNGQYIICIKTNNNVKTEPEKLLYDKKGTSSESVNIPHVEQRNVKQKEEPIILTYQAALDYQSKILQLEYEKKLMQLEIDDLTEELEEYEKECEELEAKQKTLSELPVKTSGNAIADIIKESVPALTGVVNAYFEQKQQLIKAYQDTQKEKPEVQGNFVTQEQLAQTLKDFVYELVNINKQQQNDGQ
jgi:hypothetical protein